MGWVGQRACPVQRGQCVAGLKTKERQDFIDSKRFSREARALPVVGYGGWSN